MLSAGNWPISHCTGLSQDHQKLIFQFRKSLHAFSFVGKSQTANCMEILFPFFFLITQMQAGAQETTGNSL